MGGRERKGGIVVLIQALEVYEMTLCGLWPQVTGYTFRKYSVEGYDTHPV